MASRGSTPSPRTLSHASPPFTLVLCRCGKSSLALLLTRLYAPTAGHVFLDGYDIATLDPVWLRRVVGVITQEPLLLSGTGELHVYILYHVYVHVHASGKICVCIYNVLCICACLYRTANACMAWVV